MNRKSALVAALVMALFLVSCTAPSDTLDEPPATDSPSAATPAVSSPAPPPAAGNGQAIIVDHASIDIGQIPAQWLEQAKQNVI